MRCPAAWCALPLLAGSTGAILLIDGLPRDAGTALGLAALLALIAAAGALAVRDDGTCATAVAIGCLLAGGALGETAARRACEAPLLAAVEAMPPGAAAVLEGVLREDAAPAGPGFSLWLDVRAVNGRDLPRDAGGVRLTVGGAMAAPVAGEWRAGRRVRVPAALRPPSTYLNPGGRDDRRALARRGIVFVGSVKSAALVEVVAPGGRVSEAAAAVRAWTRQRLAASLTPRSARSAGIATAVLIGDRGGLSAEDERRLQDAGTYHVIAISGGNIAILAVILLVICRLLLLPPAPAAMITAVLLLFYGSIAAGAASVARAVTVAVLVLIARAADQRGPALNVLASAAVLCVAASPLAVLDAGFILSFGATLGILLGAPRLVPAADTTGRRGMWPRVARQTTVALTALLAATVCAELALAPVGASLFGRIPLAGLILNFAAIPLMTVVQVAALVITVTGGWLEAAARPAAAAAHLASTGLLESARLLDVAPWLSVPVRPPAWWLVGVYYAAAAGLLFEPARRGAAVALVGAGVCLILGADFAARDAVPHPPAVALRVAVLDVGQADATAVIGAGGRALLVDAGGFATAVDPWNAEAAPAFDVGERVVLPALRALGVRRLDALVVTHGDPDHLLGAPGVMRRIRTSSVWEGVPVPPHPGLHALAAFARCRGASWRTVQAGDAERFGDLEIRILHPPLPQWERQRVRNDDSVVLELRLGRVSVVLPGDIGREGEGAILPRLEPGRLVVLKAPHHGSATSSGRELIEHLRPAAVIFSAGRANRFGHPHPEVVRRYREAGVEIFSTAEDGAVLIETDGEQVEVWGWRGRRAIFGAAR